MPNRTLATVAILLMGLVVGCGGPRQADGQKERPPVTSPQTPGSSPSAHDEQEALSVARAYFQFVSKKDASGAMNLLTKRWRQSTGDQALISGINAIQRIEVRELTLDSAHPRPPAAVLVRAELEVDAPGTAWNRGRNTRFVFLLKEDGVWRIDALGTG